NGFRALTLETHPSIADDHFFLAENELIERLDALHFRTPLAARARDFVGNAFETGAILQHRLERLPRQTRNPKRLETLIDRRRMAGMDHFRNARRPGAEHRLAAFDADVERRFSMQSLSLDVQSALRT